MLGGATQLEQKLQRRHMQRKRHSPEQIIRKLREAEVELSGGAAVADVCKKLSISEQTYYRWRNEYGGLSIRIRCGVTISSKIRRRTAAS